MTGAESRSRRLRRIRRLALLLTALSLLVVFVSAHLRLSGAGLGCPGWPDCYGQVLVAGPHPNSGPFRILHRIAASLSLLLGFALAWQCLRPSPVQPVARYATLLLALMIALALVGVFSADPHRVWSSFFNMLGGVALVALSWGAALAAAPEQVAGAPRRSAALLHAGLGLLALTIALGALIGARYAAIACPSLPGCSDVSWPAAAGWGALNPFATVGVATGLGDAGGVALHLLHRYAALATLLLLGVAGLQAMAHGGARASAGLMLALLLVQLALGVLTVLSGFSPGLAIAHSVCASMLVAAAITVLLRLKAGSR